MVTIKSYVGGITYWRLDGGLKVLLQESEATMSQYRWQKRQTKFPGGMSKSIDETFSSTLKREYLEETYLRLREEILDKPVYDYIHGDQRKVFFLVPFESFDGELRTKIILDNKSRLFPPYWAELEDLLDGKIRLYGHHARAFLEAVPQLKRVLF